MNEKELFQSLHINKFKNKKKLEALQNMTPQQKAMRKYIIKNITRDKKKEYNKAYRIKRETLDNRQVVNSKYFEETYTGKNKHNSKDERSPLFSTWIKKRFGLIPK